MADWLRRELASAGITTTQAYVHQKIYRTPGLLSPRIIMHFSCLSRGYTAPRTSEKTPDDSRSVAGGENTACEAQAYTSRAPSRCSTLAALVMVPARADTGVKSLKS